MSASTGEVVGGSGRIRDVTMPSRGTRLRELLAVFGTLGVIGFGGPAAHVALMRREIVERRAWLTDQQMVDLVGIANLIPVPTRPSSRCS